MWLKGRGRVDTLCHGEVAEWLNAAVSKTVTSVTPASGVRIPPSPRFGASQHFSTPPGFARRLVRRPVATPLPIAGAANLRGELDRRVALLATS
jgi:hypothetical protein